MHALQAKPAFGGKKKTNQYYEACNGIINVLRSTSTLRTIAQHLNSAGFRTPSDLIWDRQRVATYLRSTAI
jgi:hypothetical protein